jgi:hypothetical protein
MTTRSSVLGWVAKGLFLGATFIVATGCTTMRRASAPGEVIATEEVDPLEGVELDENETVAAPAAPTQPGTVDVAWTDNGTNIQLVKLPKVRPVTASMLTLDKPNAVDFGKTAPASDVPPRGTRKD